MCLPLRIISTQFCQACAAGSRNVVAVADTGATYHGQRSSQASKINQKAGKREHAIDNQSTSFGISLEAGKFLLH